MSDEGHVSVDIDPPHIEEGEVESSDGDRARDNADHAAREAEHAADHVEHAEEHAKRAGEAAQIATTVAASAAEAAERVDKGLVDVARQLEGAEERIAQRVFSMFKDYASAENVSRDDPYGYDESVDSSSPADQDQGDTAPGDKDDSHDHFWYRRWRRGI